MADFSFLSSDTDDSAVDQILAEAMDDCALKQVAAINCSSFTNSSLPSHLESRFQRLKTFPFSSKTKPQLAPDSLPESKNPPLSPPNDQNPNFTDIPERKKGSKEKSGSGYFSSPDSSKSPNLMPETGVGKVNEVKSGVGSVSFRSDSSDSGSEMVKSGCYWCSTKRVSRRKSRSRDGVDELGFGWGRNVGVLSDLKSFSSKEQKKMMKKVMKEEEDINKEAEKIVKWAKQVSARLDFSLSDDALSDGDDGGHHFGLH